MVQDIIEKIKEVPREFWDDLFTVTVIILVSLASFGLGRVSVLYDTPREGMVSIEQVERTPESRVNQEGNVAGVSSVTDDTTTTEGAYVASKEGSKYHLPWCSGAQRIKDENKIFFQTKADAEAAGYTPAANCKGI